jgi:hypothetical protein
MTSGMEWRVDIVAFLVHSAVAPRDMRQYWVFELLCRTVEAVVDMACTSLEYIK